MAALSDRLYFNVKSEDGILPADCFDAPHAVVRELVALCVHACHDAAGRSGKLAVQRDLDAAYEPLIVVSGESDNVRGEVPERINAL